MAQGKPVSTSASAPRARTGRRYIVDSGASFHLVSPNALSDEEKETIEDLVQPIPIETANGEVEVTQRAQIYVQDLDLTVWAFLHEDTVSVLSLGMLVDRNGFTYIWKPGKAPYLKKGKLCVHCQPHFNVPFIFSGTAKLPSVAPAPRTPSFDEIVEDEMQGLEDLIPGTSKEDAQSDEVPPPPKAPLQNRGRPRERPSRR